MTQLRKLVWLYLILLIFEGALRKWVVPSLDAPLLIIRDPVVLLIYYLAWTQRLSFRGNPFFVPNLVLGVLAVIFSTAFGDGNGFVTLYGIRTDFLQIPLIFLIPQILTYNDVLEMGRFILWSSIFVGILVILQFRAPPDSLLNKGAMATHFATVRPSGPFSFASGVVAFFDIVTAFLLFGYLRQGVYRNLLLATATLVTLLGAACSGSRSYTLSVACVVVVAVLVVIVQGRGGMSILIGAVVIFLGVSVLSMFSVFQQGSSQLVARFGEADAQEGSFLVRFVEAIIGPLTDMSRVELGGEGLGMGTNAAMAILKGSTERQFWGPENEWGRLIFESGPLLGVCMCFFRIALAGYIGWQSLRAMRRGNALGPLLFGASGLLIFNGQWAVPTTLGFSIFSGGLTLAACNEEVDPDGEDEDEENEDDLEGESSDEMDEADVADRT
jgi:hypothetical protein